MAAAASDLLQEVSIASATTLDSPGYTIGDTSITVVSVSTWPTATGITFAMDEVDAAGVQVPGTYNEYVGVKSSATSITSVSHQNGTNQNYTAGATTRVYIPVSAERENRIVEWGLEEHGQLGTHTDITQADANFIKDDAGNELLKWSKTTSAVNEVTIKNAATGNAPRVTASGGDTNVDLSLRGKGTGAVKFGGGATSPFAYDYVVSGCVWSGDSYGSTRAASMTSGVVVINGNPLTVATVTARSFTASKDTYVDLSDNGDGTALITYTEATNNAASPALAANSIRIAIIVTDGTDIQDAGSVNQGEPGKVLPIASSRPYMTTDSLGNLICPRDPNRKILGYMQTTSNATTTTNTNVASLSCPITVPANRKIKITVNSGAALNTGANGGLGLVIYTGATLGTLTTQIASDRTYSSTVTANTERPLHPTAIISPSSGLLFINPQLIEIGGVGTATLVASSTNISTTIIELV